MKKIWKMLIVTVMLVLIVTGCGQGKREADDIQRNQTEALIAEAQRQVGMPNIVNFQERKLAKHIIEQRDRADLVCYAYTKSDYTGKLNFIGKCIGYGLPYSVQFTSPSKIDRTRLKDFIGPGWSTTVSHVVPQPDPSGLYSPEGLSATWLMMIDPATNKARPVYIESELTVSPFKLN